MLTLPLFYEMKLENGGNIAAATAVGKEIAERAIAVSYTHLDVYKRQS